MLHGGKAAVCSNNNNNNNNNTEQCLGKTRSLLMLKMALHMVNNGLQIVKIRKWNTSIIVNPFPANV